MARAGHEYFAVSPASYHRSGRLGILEKLFKLVDHNLPVPMIGSGRNPYQFISVFDCASAARAAFSAGVPNEVYNLGSLNPPRFENCSVI